MNLGERGLLDAGLDLGEVEAVFAAAVLLDDHEVDEVVNGLAPLELRFEQTVEEDRQDVFGARGRLRAQHDVVQVVDQQDGSLDAADYLVHASAVVHLSQRADHFAQVARQVLDLALPVCLLHQAVQRQEPERPAPHVEAEVAHSRLLLHHVYENFTGDVVVYCVFDELREPIGHAGRVFEAGERELGQELGLDLGKSRVRCS